MDSDDPALVAAHVDEGRQHERSHGERDRDQGSTANGFAAASARHLAHHVQHA